MRILRKIKSFDTYRWLDFSNLPNSDGCKFEIHNEDIEVDTSEFIMLFYSLFGNYLDDLIVGQFGEKSSWDDYCIDTWDHKNDRYDYSPKGKTPSTAAYLKMLIDNNIEADYTGFCKCLNWDSFLPIIINCLVSHAAPYSIMTYISDKDVVFYFHHTGSFGVYYKELNDPVKYILERVEHEGLKISNF